MVGEVEKIQKAKIVLQKIAKGIDPLSGDVINEDSFLNDGRIVRCFYFVAEVLENVINGEYGKVNNSKGINNRLVQFIITPDEKSRVTFPDGKIGVNEFSRCINSCIDTTKSKQLSGVELNKRLKALGILGQVETGSGKTRTVTNEKSTDYGFEMEKKLFRGTEYEMVVLNDTGKRYLLDNLETILSNN